MNSKQPNGVPSINVSRKLFFSHVHKAAGTSFRTFLRDAPALGYLATRWCRHLDGPGWYTRPSSMDKFAEWWWTASGLNNCTLFSMEDPKIGAALKHVYEYACEHSNSGQHAAG